MAIYLPPAIPPQQADVQMMQQAAAAGSTYTVGSYQARVSGNTLLTAEQMQEAIGSATNPSEAVLQLAAAYGREGHMMVTLFYALDGQTLYIQVNEGYLDKLVAPEALVPFFEGFVGQKNLTRTQLDRKLVLADIKATRAGQDVAVTYQVNGSDPQKVTMIFTATPREDHDPLKISLEVGNPGNRFLGRYFAQLAARYQTREGAEYVTAWQTALTSIGNPRGGKDYNQYQFNLNHPTPLGLYGFDISHTGYTQEVMGFDFDGEIIDVGLTGQQLVWSDEVSRITLNERLEHIESEIEDTSTGVKVQDEPHSSAEIGVNYTRDMHTDTRRARLGAGIAVKTGVSNDEGTLDQDGPEVIGGRRTAEYVALKPNATYAMSIFTDSILSFDALGQITEDQVPEQQQWVLGGMGSMSAYLPGVLEGDTGYYARAKLEFASRPVWRVQIVPTLFVEAGGARFEQVSGDDADLRSIVDAGFRLAIRLGEHLTIEGVAAKSLSDRNLDDAFLDDFEVDGFISIKGTF